mgnify:CR=1 FL=1
MRPNYKLIFSLAFADVRSQKLPLLFFIMNLALGLVGLAGLDRLRVAIEQSMESKSRQVMGADLALYSREPLVNENLKSVLKILGPGTQISLMVELYSMIASEKGRSQLVQIRAIDEQFPFYGQVALTPDSSQATLHPAASAWVYPEILNRLQIKVGDSIKVGNGTFKIIGVIDNDSASGFSTAMAPRIFISLGQIEATGLVTGQSLSTYMALFKLPYLNEEQVEEKASAISSLSELPGSVRIKTHRNANDQVSRLFGYLRDYLGLISISALLLSSIGATFLMRTFLDLKVRDAAILRCLGMKFSTILTIYVVAALVLGAISGIVAFGLSSLLTPLLSLLLARVDMAVEIPLLSLSGAASVIGIGSLAALTTALPLLMRMKDIKPALLLHGQLTNQVNRNQGFMWLRNKWSVALYTIALVLLWLLSVLYSRSWLKGSVFIAAFIASGFLITAFAGVILRVFNRFSRSFPLSMRLAVRNLYRDPKSTISCFLALGLSILLLNIVPQIEANLQAELDHPEKSVLPGFFLFDIQPEQIDELTEIISSLGAELSQVSPMIRARLTHVNGEAFAKRDAFGGEQQFTREGQEQTRSRNRGYNLSYRKKLSESEKVIDGKDFSGTFDPASSRLPEISVEKSFASRLGVGVGDILTFDIQSVPIQGEVVNLRSVRWTSFQPNFFIQFQEGVLEDSPKTFLATVPDLPEEKRYQLQDVVVSRLPNISMVDVVKIASRVIEIGHHMGRMLQLMAALCLMVGIFIMYSISLHQVERRKRDINLIRMMGAPAKFVRRVFTLEFLWIAVMSSIPGILLGLSVSYFLSSLFFADLWVWDPWIPLSSLILLTSVVGVLAALSIHRISVSKPRLR